MKSILQEAFQKLEDSNFWKLGLAVVLPEDERVHLQNEA
jgi:hypothetical protein